MGKLKHSHNTISLCSAMFLDDCNAGRQCRLCFFEIFCIQSTSRPPKILYHKRGALSIRLRFRWRGAVCYTSQDLRSLTNAALLLARLRCPKKSAHPLVLDFLDRCAETTCASSAPGGAWFSQVRCTCSPSCGALKNRRIRWCLIF